MDCTSIRRTLFVAVGVFVLGGTVVSADSIRSQLNPAVYDRVLKNEVMSNAKLENQEYRFYSALLVNAKWSKCRQIMTDAQVYQSSMPYIDLARFDSKTNRLRLEGGTSGVQLKSTIQFSNLHSQKVKFEIVAGTFRGMIGTLQFEIVPGGTDQTLVLLSGQKTGGRFASSFILEQLASMVLTYVGRNMKFYIESNEKRSDQPRKEPQVDVPKPRNRI